MTRTDGRKACARCGGPVDQVRTRFRDAGLPGVVYQSWCRECKRKYAAARRQGKIEMLVTPEERAAILRARELGWPL